MFKFLAAMLFLALLIDMLDFIAWNQFGLRAEMGQMARDRALGHMPHMLSLNYAPYIERVDNIIQFVYNSFCKVRPKAETKSNPLYGAF